MARETSWSNDITLKFLDMYENEPVVWNTSIPENKNRHLVYEAWKRIEIKMGSRYSITELKKKKDSLMASYRHYMNKVKQSMKKAVTPEHVYKPPWFAFEKISNFVKDKEPLLITINTEHIYSEEDENAMNNRKRKREEEEEEEVEEVFSINSGNGELEQDDFPTDSLVLPSSSNSVFKAPLRKEKKIAETSEIKNKMNSAYSIIQAEINKPVKERSIYTLYGELLAAKLRLLDDHTRDICMHRIDTLMFEMKYNTCVPFIDNQQLHPTEESNDSHTPNYPQNSSSPASQSSIVIDHTFSIPIDSLSPSEIKKEFF